MTDNIKNKDLTPFRTPFRVKLPIAYRIIILACWIFGILAPVYAFSRGSSVSRTMFDAAFQTPVSHVLMHTFLYAVLAYLLASVFFRKGRSARQLFIFVLAAVAVVAVLQEIIQMMSGNIALRFDEFFDFFVDIAGGAGGIWLYETLHRKKGVRS